MKRTVIWLALALSVLFNVFFAAGYMQARTQLKDAESDDHVTQRVANELDLDTQQREAFARLRSSKRASLEPINDEIALLLQDLLDERTQDEPDPNRLGILEGSLQELRRQRHEEQSRRFGEFLGLLSPEQRRMLSHRSRRGHPGRGMRGSMQKRWDQNGDGVIDEQERAAAREMIERRQPRDEGRQDMFNRLDANGDGTLDFEEWSSMQRPMRRGRRDR